LQFGQSSSFSKKANSSLLLSGETSIETGAGGLDGVA
jgi:hypothetical protein